MGFLNRFASALAELDTMVESSHFTRDVAATEITITATDTGSGLVGDEIGGVLTLTPSDASVGDNDEVYAATANELFLFAVNREIYGRFRLKFAETAAGIYNAGCGFMNAVGADTLIDNGGGPKVSGSTLAIAKLDGGTVWKCYSACNGVSTVSTSTKTSTSTDWQVLEVYAMDANDGANMTVVFAVNGEHLRDSTGAVIRHSVPIANGTEMQMWSGAKLGAITNNDLFKLDYWYGAQGVRATNASFV
jgi:hypothetical protein